MTTAEISSSFNDLWADSKHGISLLSQSRQVEQNNNKQNNNNKNNNQNKNYANQVDTTWISGYSLKFQGCHQVSQWNPNVDQEEDVRIESKRLARFRLCPASSCSSNSGGGCAKGYGDYIVDMDVFLQSFMENKRQVQEEACQTYAQYNCSCQNNDDQQGCMQNCYYNAGMSECIEQNGNNQNNYNQNIDVNDYLECSAYNAGGARRLEDGGNANGNANGAEYFIGPYCSDKGGQIVLGMFTDDSCTEFADDYGGRTTYESMTGMSLPYHSTSIVDTKCYSCEGEQMNNGGYYVDQAKEACAEMYVSAGKCETQLTSALGYSAINENACTYMEGIKITRSNGIIISGAATANKVASAFIGIFSVSFVLLGSYVYYLKTKLDRGSVNLSD
eukprot:CAMPEP_0176503666 /NCGR_PEP_ID=MMETSP0200_2-20121128/15490_1 /TAXON_ID=947934 /ORGANISM="Chaetoceros sp., Strain GSL56" /LENGTH=388 /DNA_ID=CAMNT_0017902983 /DNA_START=794 /DNA_END=1960 /DNA_ORIENTATION=+